MRSPSLLAICCILFVAASSAFVVHVPTQHRSTAADVQVPVQPVTVLNMGLVSKIKSIFKTKSPPPEAEHTRAVIPPEFEELVESLCESKDMEAALKTLDTMEAQVEKLNKHEEKATIG